MNSVELITAPDGEQFGKAELDHVQTEIHLSLYITHENIISSSNNNFSLHESVSLPYFEREVLSI